MSNINTAHILNKIIDLNSNIQALTGVITMYVLNQQQGVQCQHRTNQRATNNVVRVNTDSAQNKPYKNSKQ